MRQLAILVYIFWGSSLSASPYQASGAKVGEMTDSTAIVWVRMTRHPEPNKGGVDFSREKRSTANTTDDPAEFKWATPGAVGKVRVRYGKTVRLDNATETDWAEVTAEDDFQHQFRLTGLDPDTEYFYASETATADGSTMHEPLLGSFRTAPQPSQTASVTFALLNCQQFADLDHPDGFDMYPAALALRPNFVVFTGDNVYYDRDRPYATSAELARFHWQRMYGLPRHVELLRSVGSYWIKDDHDTLGDDCWPGKVDRRLAPFTFAEGQRIFRQQVPIDERTYRTVRWGRDLQIWIIEGRDFRSPNTDPDGPEKTILGSEQMRWLKETLLASDATWRVLLSPTPWVGPDREGGKADNHSNASFQHESTEMLDWFRENVSDNFAIVCGDRHWQYHSVHPKFGIHEFSVGPCTDAHAQHPQENPVWHQFFRDKGGFASVSVGRLGSQAQLAIRLHDTRGNVVHEWKNSVGQPTLLPASGD